MKKISSLLILAILIISIAHYATPIHDHHLHAIFQRLFYIPIIIGALVFELWPGILFALFTALLYLPHIFIQWNGMSNDMFTKVIEVAMMLIISLLTGLLARRFRKEREKAESAIKQLARMDRLAMLGKLSAGLAHEIRNPLGSLVGSAEILEIELGENHPQAPFVEILHTELKRLTDRLNQFLRFSKPAEPTMIENSLVQIADSTIELILQDAQKNSVTITTVHQNRDKLILMDSEQIRQVLLNLLLNAIQQMKEGGQITVTTFYNEKEFGLSVQDEGGGIQEEILPQLFEPFFTTKESGTGLGLAIAHEMITNLNGTITAENYADGALFTIRINYGK